MIALIVATLAPIVNSINSPIIQNLYNKKCKGFIIIFFITHFDN